MPLRDFICDYCDARVEKLVYGTDPEEIGNLRCACGSRLRILPALIGGYHGATSGASTRPKNSTAMKSGKVFTGNKEPKKD